MLTVTGSKTGSKASWKSEAESGCRRWKSSKYEKCVTL
jgi:hypothetical protein